MTNHNDQIKGLLKAILVATPNAATDDRQAGRQDVAEYVLAAITLLESGVVTSLGFERCNAPEPKPSHPGAGTEVYESLKIEVEHHEPESYVVQVNGQYTYISDVQPRVQIGETVDIEARSGGHWQGEVTDIFSVDDYAEDHDLPTLKILGLF